MASIASTDAEPVSPTLRFVTESATPRTVHRERQPRGRFERSDRFSREDASPILIAGRDRANRAEVLDTLSETLGPGEVWVPAGEHLAKRLQGNAVELAAEHDHAACRCPQQHLGKGLGLLEHCAWAHRLGERVQHLGAVGSVAPGDQDRRGALALGGGLAHEAQRRAARLGLRRGDASHVVIIGRQG